MPEKHYMVSYCTFSYGGSLFASRFLLFWLCFAFFSDNFYKQSILQVFDNNLSAGYRTNSSGSDWPVEIEPIAPGQLSQKSDHLVTAVKSAVLPKTKWRPEEKVSLADKSSKKFLWRVWKPRKVKVQKLVWRKFWRCRLVILLLFGLLFRISTILERKPSAHAQCLPPA